MKTNFKILFSVIFMLAVSLAWAQMTVTGTVTDEDGFAMPNTNVINKTSGETAMTDLNGNYSIQANEGDVIEVDAIGYSLVDQTVSNSNKINFSVSSGQLDEVVVTALNINREKQALGYSVQEVSGEELTKSRPGNAISALSGSAAGVSITNSSGLGTSTRILLRGTASVTQDNKPLIVVDGIPMNNEFGNVNSANTQRGGGGRDYGDTFFDINPDDIETYSILKGGPASALYGSRGKNGVILITTKKAKGDKLNLEINTGLNMVSNYIAPPLQNEYGGGGGPFGTADINGETYNLVAYAVDESWGPKYDPSLFALQWDAFDPEFPDEYLKPRAWVAPQAGVEDFFSTGVTYNNSVAISKAFGNSNVRLSLGNLYTKGVVPNTKLDKTTLGLSFATDVSKSIELTTQINYVNTTGFNRPEVGYGDNSVYQKFYQWGQRQLDYNRLRAYKTPDGRQRTWNRISYSNPTPKYSDNPYWTIYENIGHDKRNRFYGNVGMKYDIPGVKGLYATGKVYGDQYDWSIDTRVAVGSQAQSNYSESKRTFREYNTEGMLHYDRDFGKFSLTSFFGANRRDVRYERLSGTTVGGLGIPGLYNLSNSLSTPEARNFYSHKRVNSLMGFLSLGFNDIFFLELTGRNDWFSTLDPENNSEFYPSVSGSFVFSKLAKADWLNFGKIRGGWAEVSNDTDPYSLYNAFNVENPFGNAPQYILPTSSKNPNLRPELKRTWEIGLEMQLLKNRLGFDVTYYNEDNYDLIISAPVTAATGYQSVFGNTADMTNKGYEITLNLTPVKKTNFQWDVTWNFAQNRNKLNELKGDNDALRLTSLFTARLYAIKGESYGQIYGTDFVYDDNGNKVIGSNGQYLRTDENVSLGSVLPDYNSGLRNSFRIKNFNFSFLIDRQKGGKYFSVSHMWGMYSGMLDKTAANGIRENGIVLDGVLEDGSVNDINVSAPAYGAYHYFGPAAQNVFDADYFKLRQVSLSYTIPSELFGRNISSMTIALFGRNLATWGLDWKGMDPEQASYGSGNIQGIEGGSAPSTREYGINVNIRL